MGPEGSADGAAPETGTGDSSEIEPSSLFSGGRAQGHVRARASAAALVVACVFLATGLGYLVATQVPGKPLPVVVASLLLVALFILLGVAVVRERRAGARRLDAVLVKASDTLRSIEAVTDPGLAFLDFDDLLAEVLDRTNQAVAGDVACMLLVTDDGSTLRVRASTGATKYAPIGSEVPVGDGVLGTAARLVRPVVVTDVETDGKARLLGAEKGIASLAAAPLIVHGTTIGLVEVASVAQRSFDAAELRLLQVVADRLAALVERARLDDVARRSRLSAEHANLHLRILERGGRVLGRALEDYEGALADLGDVLVPDFADWFAVHFLEEPGRVRCVVTRSRQDNRGAPRYPTPHEEELVLTAMAERRPQMLVPTLRLDTAEVGAAVHTPESLGERPGAGSMLVIPVHVRGAVMIALSFATGPERRGFRPSDLETAKELADRVRATIERVLSWRASERAGDLAFQYAKRLRRLVDAALVMNERFSEGEMLQLLAEHAHQALDAEVTVVSRVPGGDAFVENVWPIETDLSGAGAGVERLVLDAAEAVARTGEVVRTPDEWSGRDAGPAEASNAPDAVRGWIAAPITDSGGAVRRVVVVVGSKGTLFNFDDESVLTLLAQMSSVALRNASLYAEVLGNQQRLQTLVDASPVAILELAPTGEAQWWNPAAEELFGWPDDELPRRIPVRPGFEPVLAGLIESCLAGNPLIGVALPVAGTDGEPLELSVSASPVGQAGSVSGLLVVAEDVTERQRMLQEFHQAERLNAMSHMAGAVAHDFNNLLTVILGCTDVLMRRLGEDEDLAPDVAAIHRAGTRAAALTSQLVRIGGQEHAVQPELVHVDEVVDSLQPMLSGVLGEHIRVMVVAGPGDKTVLIDRSELERSVLNLAINARDAMPDGGTFTIETLRTEPVRASGEDVVRLVFADTGVGMDEDTAAKCFEPFFTTKGRARGTGLGLATVSAMVSRAGGEVQVESSPGAGARFAMTFPAAEPLASLVSPEVRRGPSVSAETSRGSETLLVVDDEPEVLRLEVRELRFAGYDVVAASGAGEALEALTSHGRTVDLLITDVVMPGMTGIELAAAARRHHPGLAVLFVSGHLEDEASLTVALREQESFLTKPFGPDELARRVREVLAKARASWGDGDRDAAATSAAAGQGSKR